MHPATRRQINPRGETKSNPSEDHIASERKVSVTDFDNEGTISLDVSIQRTIES